jgi:type IV secretory pathway TraG/TraD family ATPase VirD4
LRQVMDQGKMLLVNLAKGKIREDNAALLGAMLVSKIALAALSRTAVSEAECRDFYLYLDEFQNFTTLGLATMLSEFRKFGIGLILSHQYLSQIDPQIRNAILGNAGTIISFRVGSEDAEILEREFQPEFRAVDLTSFAKLQLLSKTHDRQCSVEVILRGDLENV